MNELDVISRLVRAMQEYGCHKETCAKMENEHADCTCGFSTELDYALRQGSGENIEPAGWQQG